MKPTNVAIVPTATDTATTNWATTLELVNQNSFALDVDSISAQPGSRVMTPSPAIMDDMDDTVVGLAPARVPSRLVFNTPRIYRPSSDLDVVRPGSVERRFAPVKKINFDDVDTDGPNEVKVASGFGTGGEDVETQVANLLMKLFSADEMRQFLRYRIDSSIEGALPGTSSSVSTLADKAAKELERRGLINKLFFDNLISERPGRQCDIERVMNATGRNANTESAAPPAQIPQRPAEIVATLFQSMYSPEAFARMIFYLSDDLGAEMVVKLPNAALGNSNDIFALGVAVLQRFGMLGKALDAMANERPERAGEIPPVRKLAEKAELFSPLTPPDRVTFALPPEAAIRTIRTTAGKLFPCGVGVQFKNFFKLMKTLFDGESFRRFVLNQVSDRIAALLPDNTAPEEEIIYVGVVAMFDSDNGVYLENALRALLTDRQYSQRFGDIRAVIDSGSSAILIELGLKLDWNKLGRSTEYLHGVKFFDHLMAIKGVDDAGLRRIATALQLGHSIAGATASLAHLTEDLIADVERNGMMKDFLIALHHAYPHDQKLAALIAEFWPGHLRASPVSSLSPDSQGSGQQELPLPPLKKLQPNDVTPKYEEALSHLGLVYEQNTGLIKVQYGYKMNANIKSFLQQDVTALKRVFAKMGLYDENRETKLSFMPLWYLMFESIEERHLLPQLIVSLSQECPDDLTLSILAAPFLR